MISGLPIAYIDPGSGMQFFSSAGPFVAAIFAAVASVVLWPLRQAKNLFASQVSSRILAWGVLLAILAAGVILYFFLK